MFQKSHHDIVRGDRGAEAPRDGRLEDRGAEAARYDSPPPFPPLRIWLAGALLLVLVEAFNIASGELTGRTPIITWTPAIVVNDLLYWFSWLAVSPLVFLVARRFRLDRPTPASILVHLMSALALFALAAVVRTVVRWPLFGLDRDTWFETLRYSFSFSLMTFGLLYAVTVILYYALEYYYAFHSRELRASQLETMVVRAQLEALRNQLQPHFLFNTLHTISALMSKDVPAARRMMTRFSDLLRLTLDQPEQHEVPLGVELRFLDQYLDLQRMRFGDRLHTQVSAEQETLDCLVPRLILQPVVENALTHGIGRRAGIGHLDVSARQDGSMLHLSVDDDGAGVDAGDDGLLREGVGLRSTRGRLRHL